MVSSLHLCDVMFSHLHSCPSASAKQRFLLFFEPLGFSLPQGVAISYSHMGSPREQNGSTHQFPQIISQKVTFVGEAFPVYPLKCNFLFPAILYFIFPLVYFFLWLTFNTMFFLLLLSLFTFSSRMQAPKTDFYILFTFPYSVYERYLGRNRSLINICLVNDQKGMTRKHGI